MCRSTRFTVRPSTSKGWFSVIDTATGQVATELRGRTDANRRCRAMNTIAKEQASDPCNAIDAHLEDRDETEARIKTLEFEAAELCLEQREPCLD